MPSIICYKNIMNIILLYVKTLLMAPNQWGVINGDVRPNVSIVQTSFSF